METCRFIIPLFQVFVHFHSKKLLDTLQMHKPLRYNEALTEALNFNTGSVQSQLARSPCNNHEQPWRSMDLVHTSCGMETNKSQIILCWSRKSKNRGWHHYPALGHYCLLIPVPFHLAMHPRKHGLSFWRHPLWHAGEDQWLWGTWLSYIQH